MQIDEGNFLGQNGGAFFYGDDSSNACVTNIAKGKFLSVYNASGGVLGLCGICVMGNADLTMNDVYINAANAAISVEGSSAVSVDNRKAKITITGGEYITNGGAVIFNYGNFESYSYATWKITGGHFQVGGTGGKIFQTQWGSYAPLEWNEILGTGYQAYYKSGSTYTDVSSASTSNTSYNNIYVSATTPA